MPRTPLITTGLIAFSLFTSLPAFAASSPLPPEHTHGAVTYRSGGIGQEETQAFEAAAKHYPLSLAFVIKHRPRAEFTSNVHVTISDAQGQSVLDTHSDGPFLLAKLPAGRYTVTAERGRQAQTKTVHVVTHKPAHLVFQWAA
jgi:hypothetical protein